MHLRDFITISRYALGPGESLSYHCCCLQWVHEPCAPPEDIPQALRDDVISRARFRQYLHSRVVTRGAPLPPLKGIRSIVTEGRIRCGALSFRERLTFCTVGYNQLKSGIDRMTQYDSFPAPPRVSHAFTSTGTSTNWGYRSTDGMPICC